MGGMGTTASQLANTILAAIRDRLPAVLGAGGGVKIDGSGTALPVSGPLTDTQLRATAVPTLPNAVRGAHALHRNAITAADKLLSAVAGDVLIADNGAGTGSLSASTAYYVTGIAGNDWGPCAVVAAAIKTLTTAAYGGATGSIRLAYIMPTDGGHVDVFLSTDVAPKWVGRLTTAQLAAGGARITDVGVVDAAGSAPAGSVDILKAGTGNQTSHAVWAQNNAYTPSAAGIIAIDTTGYTYLRVQVLVAVTDLRSGIGASIVPFWSNPTDATRWHQGTRLPLSLLSATGLCLQQEFILETNGAPAMDVLVDGLIGQGAAVSIWCQPY